MKGTYRLRVRTKGADPSWGAWSEYAVFRVADPPQAFFTTPTEDGEAVVELPLRAAWTAVDETGITYSFNEYEIAAYVVGVTNVHLPYKEIRYLLRDDSPISQLIEN